MARKGQTLFIRPATPDDAPALSALCGAAAHEPAYVARLVGETVAAATLSYHGSEAQLDSLGVSPDLRGIRVGSKFIGELARRLAARGTTRLIARPGSLPPEFLRHAGFIETGGVFVLNISM